MPIKEIYHQTGQFTSTTELQLLEMKAVQDRQDLKDFEEQSPAIAKEFAKRFPAVDVSTDRGAFAQNKYIADRYERTKAVATAEERKRFDARGKYIDDQIANNPTLQVELKNRQNFIDSDHAGVDFATFMHLSASSDPRAKEAAMGAQAKVFNDLKRHGGRAVTMETARLATAMIAMVPNRNEKDVSFGTPEDPLTNDELTQANIDAGGVTTGRIATGTGDLQEEALISAMQEFTKMFDNVATNPEKAGKAYAASAFTAAGIDAPETTGVVIEQSGVGAHRSHNLAVAVQKAFGELSDNPDYGFASRNKAVADSAFEIAGITAGNTPAAEYQQLTVGLFRQIEALRNIDFSAISAAATLGTKQEQMDAYEEIVGTANDMMTQLSINPDAFAQTLEASQGSADALTAIALIGGTGKMDILDALDRQDFRQDWSDISDADQYGYFVNKVLDVMFDSTRSISDDNKQMQAISVLRKLKGVNGESQLGTEPMLDHIFGTMHDMFKRTAGIDFANDAAVAQNMRQNLNQRMIQVGDKKYLVSGGIAPNDPQTHADAGRRVDELAFNLQAYPELGNNLELVGLVGNNRNINVDAGGVKTIMDLTKTENANPLLSDEYAVISRTEQGGNLTAIYDRITTVSEADFDALGRVSTSKDRDSFFGENEYLAEVLGVSTPMGEALFNTITADHELRFMAQTKDPRKMQAVVTVALGKYIDVQSSAATAELSEWVNGVGDAIQFGVNDRVGLRDLMAVNPNKAASEIVQHTEDFWQRSYETSDSILSLQGAVDSMKAQRLATKNRVRTLGDFDDTLTKALGIPNVPAAVGVIEGNALIGKLTKQIKQHEELISKSLSFEEREGREFALTIPEHRREISERDQNRPPENFVQAIRRLRTGSVDRGN